MRKHFVFAFLDTLKEPKENLGWRALERGKWRRGGWRVLRAEPRSYRIRILDFNPGVM